MSEIVQSTLEATKAHPGRALARSQIIFAVISCGLGIALVGPAPIGAGVFFVIGASLGWSVWQTLRSVREMGLLTRAIEACRRGDRDAAIALIEAAEKRPSLGAKRSSAVCRAMVALNDGNPSEAQAHATVTIDASLPFLQRDLARSQNAGALSIRALARASLRDHAGALVDAERACDSRYATPSTWGEAKLARAVVAANEDRKADVRDILKRAAPYLDDIGGRERALVRALAKYAADKKRSIYRHAANPHEPSAIAAWLGVKPLKATEVVGVIATHEKPVRESMFQTARTRLLVVWVLLILMFLAIWQFLNPPRTPPQPRPPVEGGHFLEIIGVSVVIGLAVTIALALRKATQQRTARRDAVIRALNGDPVGLVTLDRQAALRSPDACLELAMLAERACNFEMAMHHCTDGLKYRDVSMSMRTMTFDLVAPSLVAVRAFCLAALGKFNEASTDLASMPNATNFAFAATAHTRVQFAQAMARGDRAGALEIARRCSDTLPLPSRDAFLIDLLEATDGVGADDDEWTRLHAELASNPALAKWVEHFMPGIGEGRIKRRVLATPTTPNADEELELSDSSTAVPQ